MILVDKRGKANLVLQLHNQGKTYREIAQEMHMSLRDISSTIKKSIEDKERIRTDSLKVPEIVEHKQLLQQPRQYMSKQSQALKLFSEDWKPLDIAIELDLPADEVHKLYKDYLKLNGLHHLVQVYEDIDYNLYTILDLYRIMKQNNISHQEILEAIKHGNKLQYLNDICQKLTNDIITLQSTRDSLKNDLSVLRSETSSLVGTKRVLNDDIQNRRHDISNLKNKLLRLQNLVNLKLDKEEYQNIERFVEQTVWSMLYEKEELFVIAVGVVLEAYLSDPTIGPHLAASSSQISFCNRILQSSKRLYNEAERLCVDRTMNKL